MHRKLFGKNSMDSDAIGQPLITYFAFVKYLRKMEKKEAVGKLFVECKEACNSVGREFAYNFLIELGIHMKLVRLIKTCLTETYTGDRVGKYLSDVFPIRMFRNKEMLYCHCFSTLL